MHSLKNHSAAHGGVGNVASAATYLPDLARPAPDLGSYYHAGGNIIMEYAPLDIHVFLLLRDLSLQENE